MGDGLPLPPLPSPPVPSPPLPSRSGVLLGGVGTTEEVERYDLKTQVEGNLKKQSATKQGKHVKMKGGTNTCVFFLLLHTTAFLSRLVFVRWGFVRPFLLSVTGFFVRVASTSARK